MSTSIYSTCLASNYGMTAPVDWYKRHVVCQHGCCSTDIPRDTVKRRLTLVYIHRTSPSQSVQLALLPSAESPFVRRALKASRCARLFPWSVPSPHSSCNPRNNAHCLHIEVSQLPWPERTTPLPWYSIECSDSTTCGCQASHSYMSRQ